MNNDLTINITEDDTFSIRIPETEALTPAQSAIYLLISKYVDGEERVCGMAEELINEYNEGIEVEGGSVH